MSTTMQGIDARHYLVGWMKGLGNMFTADVMAIPEEKWTESFGGCTRPTHKLAADAISMIYWVAEAINGNVMDDKEGAMYEKLTSEVDTREKAVAKLNEAIDTLASSISNASDDRLNTSIMAPWGMETPLFTLAHIAVSHIWYHDGQLNYIHCLLGDDKVYWMS